jgi:AraC-like DNA-binding protein
MLQKNEGRIMAFRPQPRGLGHLALGVRSAGRYRVDQGWRDRLVKKPFLQLHWVEAGSGTALVGSKKHHLGPGSVFLHYHGEEHRLYAESKTWRFCWLTMDHPASQRWMEDSGLKLRHQQAGKCPTALFERLIGLLSRSKSPTDEYRAAMLAYRIVLQAAGNLPRSSGNPLADKARLFIEDHFANPAWGIEQLAEIMQVHRTTLFRVFGTEYGHSPSAFLRNMRVQRAIYLLRNSHLPITEISRQAGFSDPNYFSRVIRATTSMSPKQFRKS